MKQSKEDMLELLIKRGVDAESDDIQGDYNRVIKFTAFNVEYKIVWWTNVSYLYIGNVQIVFNNIDVSGSWPNKFKLNINFTTPAGTVCILPIKEYEE